MSVTRYECGMTNAPTEYQSPTMHQDADGGYVAYEDYAALEQRLIESERYGRQTDITIDNLEMKLAQMAAENTGLKESRQRLAEFIHEELDADYPLNMDIETPATDAFLAEVRAQGVEMFAKEMHADISGDDAREFAGQLRKGVQS